MASESFDAVWTRVEPVCRCNCFHHFDFTIGVSISVLQPAGCVLRLLQAKKRYPDSDEAANHRDSYKIASVARDSEEAQL